MSDRFDYHKGRYVRYDYEPKGDVFSRDISPQPRVLKVVRNGNTGNEYYRRIRTDETKSVTVSTVIRKLSEDQRQRLDELTVYLEFTGAFLDVRTEPPGIPVWFTSTTQHIGRRWWFLCPYCDRRVGKLHAVRMEHEHVWGCQKCLGLTHPSKALHKTRRMDEAILEGRADASFLAFMRAHERDMRRLGRISARTSRWLAELQGE